MDWHATDLFLAPENGKRAVAAHVVERVYLAFTILDCEKAVPSDLEADVFTSLREALYMTISYSIHSRVDERNLRWCGRGTAISWRR